MCFGDSNFVLYNNINITERFTKPWRKDIYYGYTKIKENSHIKSIIRKGLDINWEYDGDAWSSNPHTPYGLNKLCNALSQPVSNSPFSSICYEVAYIRHYTTKTIEEYAIKVSRQCADIEGSHYSFIKFFRVNDITLRKLIWLRNKYPKVSIWSCIKEKFKYSIVNYNLPFRFLYKSLKK